MEIERAAECVDDCCTGRFWWDRNYWKYAAKYYVMIPQEFVEHVISGTGDKLLESHATDTSSWSDRIEEHCRNTPHGNFLPKSAGNLDLKDF